MCWAAEKAADMKLDFLPSLRCPQTVRASIKNQQCFY